MSPEISLDSIPEHWHPTSELEHGLVDEELRELAEHWWINNCPPPEFADIYALSMEEFVEAVLLREAA